MTLTERARRHEHHAAQESPRYELQEPQEEQGVEQRGRQASRASSGMAEQEARKKRMKAAETSKPAGGPSSGP